jgi:ATP-dependent exoDNAse (exonuclease V) beta subunit
MKFDYPEMTTVPFSGMRFYETPSGKFYPSITTVLGGTASEEKTTALKKWQTSLGADKAQQKTQEAADRGTAVHLLCERFLNKEELFKPNEKFNLDDVKCFNALKLKLNKVEEVWGQEVALYSDLIELAGRCDLLGIYKGKPCIIDFKTSVSIKNESRIEDYKLQLCAYSIMHNEMFNTNITHGVILMSSAGGFPQEFNVNLLDYVEPLIERINAFYKQLSKKIAA